MENWKLSDTSTLSDPTSRCLHAIKLKPELSTLDCGTMAFDERIYVARMSDLRAIATLMRNAGVKPELECFDLGHIETAKRLIEEGTIDGPPLFQFCLSTGYGAPATATVIQAMNDLLPKGALWGGFGCGIDEMPAVGQLVAGGACTRGPGRQHLSPARRVGIQC